MTKIGLFAQGEFEEYTKFISFLLKYKPLSFVVFWENEVTYMPIFHISGSVHLKTSRFISQLL